MMRKQANCTEDLWVWDLLTGSGTDPPSFLTFTMDVLRTRSVRFVSSLPVRLYRALPAVILGTLLNILDVSTGILVFPENGAFRSLQLQGLSLYIMSGLTSQIVMTLGGSRFPGAMGTMLIEILPFLRGMANDIRAVLGNDHPGLIPTVMAAYALTSFLTGAAFFILGILKLGNLVAYFPQTVLTGAIGALGVSLFVLGLGLPFPSSATPLSLSDVRSTLFDKGHLGLLAASFFPAFILSVSLRSRYIELWTRRLIRSAYYIPIFLLIIPTVFWITVRALGVPNERLVATGWLFPVDSASLSSSGIVASWNYWVLFDFRLVEWWSLKSAIQNIVLLVFIGWVIPLGINLLLRQSAGQGAANIFAGLVGTVPNMLQYSYSVYVTRAKGGRFELSLVILLTSALFLCSGLLLPYVPTILASAVVLFFGIELFLEAIWEASKTLAWMEYTVVVVTLVACTFLGFTEGFGVGIGAAAGMVDARCRSLSFSPISPSSPPLLTLPSGFILCRKSSPPPAARPPPNRALPPLRASPLPSAAGPRRSALPPLAPPPSPSSPRVPFYLLRYDPYLSSKFYTHQASSPKFPLQYLQIPNSIPSSLSSAVSFLMYCLRSQTARLCLCGDPRETRGVAPVLLHLHLDICSIHLHDLSKTASSRSLSPFTSASTRLIIVYTSCIDEDQRRGIEHYKGTSIPGYHGYLRYSCAGDEVERVERDAAAMRRERRPRREAPGSFAKGLSDPSKSHFAVDV
ncbi:hypothetical protein B0H19DRAFT_1278936 [Mycena capillaripes]|nr:hypothetical protein B0H19DRAFT_1278936 [Mycena capillaripes]